MSQLFKKIKTYETFDYRLLILPKGGIWLDQRASESYTVIYHSVLRVLRIKFPFLSILPGRNGTVNRVAIRRRHLGILLNLMCRSLCFRRQPLVWSALCSIRYKAIFQWQYGAIVMSIQDFLAFPGVGETGGCCWLAFSSALLAVSCWGLSDTNT